MKKAIFRQTHATDGEVTVVVDKVEEVPEVVEEVKEEKKEVKKNGRKRII